MCRAVDNADVRNDLRYLAQVIGIAVGGGEEEQKRAGDDLAHSLVQPLARLLNFLPAPAQGAAPQLAGLYPVEGVEIVGEMGVALPRAVGV